MAATVTLAALQAIGIGSSIIRELCESDPDYDTRDTAVSVCLPIPPSKRNDGVQRLRNFLLVCKIIYRDIFIYSI